MNPLGGGGGVTIPLYRDKESIADIIMGDERKELILKRKKKQPSVFMIDMNIFGVK